MPPNNEPEPQQRGIEALKQHVINNKIDMLLWTTRVLTMLCTFAYFIPIFGNPHSAYNKALIANAATSALRLHQRQPRMIPSLETIYAILNEDSCHYLIYSLIFLFVSPFTLVLVPIFLFSLLHFASYSLTLLDMLGQNSWWGARILISLIELQTRKILSLIALTEILLMPFSLILLFMSRAGLLIPFVYSQFLMMRYKSQRNVYNRNMFSEIRKTLETYANQPTTAKFLRVIINSGIQFVCRFAPPMSRAQAQ